MTSLAIQTQSYVLAPVLPTTALIAFLDDGTPVMGGFDTDDTPFCVKATTADWQIGAGSDGFIELEHRTLDIQLGINVAHLPAVRAQIRALAALLEGGAIERINTLVLAWDKGELAPLQRR